MIFQPPNCSRAFRGSGRAFRGKRYAPRETSLTLDVISDSLTVFEVGSDGKELGNEIL